ncbi:UvrD-helicase domain-containing protein [bacterium]|nr:UvrD-helicase domain-containing protein [bacterium]
MTSKAAKSNKILEQLNDVQQNAVAWTDGPSLILAGAGSGKTRVLTHKIAYLIDVSQVKPWKILAMTFTNKAAGEMKERIQTLTRNQSDAVWMGTFHSIFARILRKEATALGFTSNFTIYDTTDQQQLIKQIMKDTGISPKQTTPRSVQSRISQAKNNLETPEQFAESADDFVTGKIALIYKQYQQRLRNSNAMDFDDLLWKPIELFETHPEILAQYQQKFQYLLVDEYQDTNRAQYLLIKMLSDKHRNITVVGDDDQSIYLWRGADIRNILDFEKDFPETKTFRLEQNYRSTKNILGAANCVVKNNTGRLEKTLWTQKDAGDKISLLSCPSSMTESYKIIENIQSEIQRNHRNFNDFAILYRTNAQSRILEDGLRNSGISYVIVGGTKFYDRKEIKDVLAYLRLLINPLDTISARRIINFPARRIGPTTVNRISEYAIANTLPFFEALGQVAKIEGINASAKMQVNNFYKMICKYQSLQDKLSVSELSRALIDNTGILPYFKTEGSVESLSRYDNVQELLTAIGEFSKRTETPTLAAFLEEVSLIADIDSWNDRRNSVTLMTLHAAKGLEFPVIFISGLEEGLFPLSRNFDSTEALEEERRLFYVGATRAQEKLFLSWAAQRFQAGERFNSMPSRFINEISEVYLEKERRREPSNHSSGSRRTPKTRLQREMDGVYYEFEDNAGFSDDVPMIQLFEFGMRVKHAKFGKGIIRDVDGSGESLKVTVNFENVGQKKLMVKYANLEII